MEGIIIKPVDQYEEILGIKQLQTINLKENISDQEKALEGFVTANYSIEFLQEMNNLQPSIIAKTTDTNEVIGYVLAAPREIAEKHPILKGLMETIDQFFYEDKRIKDLRYVMSGQVCIAKQYRGKGLLVQLYQSFYHYFKDKYDYCITEVDDVNQRSVHAHRRCGFQIVHSGESGNGDGIYWHLVLWDWVR